MMLSRRRFLKVLLTLAAIAGLYRPRPALAAEWPKEAFSAPRVDRVLKHLYGTAKTTSSSRIHVRLASVVNDGTRVPIAVSASLKDVETITVIIEKNPRPLAAYVDVRQATPYFWADLKMASSSRVICVVQAGGKLYSLTRRVKVALGATQK